MTDVDLGAVNQNKPSLRSCFTHLFKINAFLGHYEDNGCHINLII